MLTHQKQGEDECFLASVAILAGQPLAAIKSEALAWSGRDTWTDIYEDSLLFWAMVHRIVRKYLPYPDEFMVLRSIESIGNVNNGNPNLVGKGLLVIRSPNMRHCVAFEDNIIYDSDEAYAMPCDTWWRCMQAQHSGIYIELVSHQQQVESAP